MGPAATIYLVRHAKAMRRDRAAAEGVPDFERPLRKRGWRQAEMLAAYFAARPVAAVHTSPVLRCAQTAEPIAAACGLELLPDARLSDQDGSFARLGGLLAEFCAAAVAAHPHGTVVAVSHGDSIPAYLEREAAVVPNLSAQAPCQTGSAWRLGFAGGALRIAEYLPFR